MPDDKARESIRSCLFPIAETETVKVRQALGRVLAEDIVPRINVPAHDTSAMDGYAACSSDLKGEERGLSEVGTALAGRPFGATVRPGKCVRVMTGAAMPPGTDTVA